ncbi:hypothetical protein M407DRAFT_19700 [Tulasnella calospora MUT 4182]|uniref:Uncharacterized protein n=1 Tax=Tulasnella calospora MUT 4182 TaxID=1051891 RepID=A0A0C3QHK9_9AGAM|nr:hypothetical protein M407DRAFT_19700 [Tulasnella calospora MUT 4182]
MENETGGVGGISRLCQTVFNFWAGLQSRWGRDHIRQFFLLVKLYNDCSQIRAKPEVLKKVQGWFPEAQRLVQSMEEVGKKKTKEEAEQMAEYICTMMMSIIESLGLNLAESGDIGVRWMQAKKDSKALGEVVKRLPKISSTGTAAPGPNTHNPVSVLKLNIQIYPITEGPVHRLGLPETRILSFAAKFADYCLGPLVFHELNHPEEASGAGVSPLKIQAMDTIYLRFLPSCDDAAIWAPVDPRSPVTLTQYYTKGSRVEVRFLRCNIRFLLVSAYHSEGQHEQVFDLDSPEQCQILAEVLKEGSLETNISSSEPASATSSKGFKPEVIPRTCFVLKQPNLYETFPPMHPSINDLSFIV